MFATALLTLFSNVGKCIGFEDVSLDSELLRLNCQLKSSGRCYTDEQNVGMKSLTNAFFGGHAKISCPQMRFFPNLHYANTLEEAWSGGVVQRITPVIRHVFAANGTLVAMRSNKFRPSKYTPLSL